MSCPTTEKKLQSGQESKVLNKIMRSLEAEPPRARKISFSKENAMLK